MVMSSIWELTRSLYQNTKLKNDIIFLIKTFNIKTMSFIENNNNDRNVITFFNSDAAFYHTAKYRIHN